MWREKRVQQIKVGKNGATPLSTGHVGGGNANFVAAGTTCVVVATGDRCNRLSKLLGFGGTCSLLKIHRTLDEHRPLFSFFYSPAVEDH